LVEIRCYQFLLSLSLGQAALFTRMALTDTGRVSTQPVSPMKRQNGEIFALSLLFIEGRCLGLIDKP
jgi:hypothetical protein